MMKTITTNKWKLYVDSKVEYLLRAKTFIGVTTLSNNRGPTSR